MRRKSKRWAFAAHRTFRESKILYDTSANQMFLNDAFQSFRTSVVVPGPFGINKRDGPVLTNAQAIGASTIDPVAQAQFD